MLSACSAIWHPGIGCSKGAKIDGTRIRGAMVKVSTMKVLVIGGTGLISTAIVDQLIARGDDVTVYNRGVTPKRVVGEVRIIKGDRWKYDAFESEMKQHRFDAVIDMVAYAPEAAESVVRAFAGRAAHLVVCSTVSVYGGPMTKLPATDDEPHRPVTGYGRNKSKIESILLSQEGKDGTHATVLRPSFTTGEERQPMVCCSTTAPSAECERACR